MTGAPHRQRLAQFEGLMVGTAVGDSLGLPAEGMSRERVQRRWHGLWKQRLLFGYGMVSDDTEHMVFVAQTLLTHPDNAGAFQRCLAWKLRFWLLGLPAGIGLATLKSILRLWVGFSPERSGVKSAGNGPAMRSAIIGLYFAHDTERRHLFVAASTRLTHTDARAEIAALAVAEAAAWVVHQDEARKDWLARLAELGHDEEWKWTVGLMTTALESDQTVQAFADMLGQTKGVSGYAFHSVPVALYCWLRHGDDFRHALTAALDCGGDTDTVGAIVGALMGARLGREAIPPEWAERVCDRPRSTGLLIEVAERLHRQQNSSQALGPVRYFWPWLIMRNGVFLLTVLFHGFRRLLPPY